MKDACLILIYYLAATVVCKWSTLYVQTKDTTHCAQIAYCGVRALGLSQ